MYSIYFSLSLNWALFPGAHVYVCELYKHKKKLTHSLGSLCMESEEKIYIKRIRRRRRKKIDWNLQGLYRERERSYQKERYIYTWICYKKHKKKNARNSQQKKWILMAAPNCIKKNSSVFWLIRSKKNIDRGKRAMPHLQHISRNDFMDGRGATCQGVSWVKKHEKIELIEHLLGNCMNSTNHCQNILAVVIAALNILKIICLYLSAWR